MNYLIVEGYRDAAAHFLDESGTEPKVDLRTIEERVAIRKVCGWWWGISCRKYRFIEISNIEFSMEPCYDTIEVA